jgi:DNA gyrase inhibitor GyrI
MFSRCVLLRDTVDGYFSFGLWGKQDINKQKQAIPMAIKSDDRAITYPNDVRQDIPINNRKGKYKTVTILQAGKALPNSSINEFDFDVMLVDNTRKR